MKKENKLMGVAKNEIVVYQPNETMRLDVRLENETATRKDFCLLRQEGVRR